MSGTIATAYAEQGNAYRAAVDVTLFTYKMFYARTLAVFTGATFLVTTEVPSGLTIGVTLLVISAFMTFFVTTRQMRDNQRVIQKILASGFLMEIRNPGLGYRYVHEIHLPDKECRRAQKYTASTQKADTTTGPGQLIVSEEERNITSWDAQRAALIAKYTDPCATDEDAQLKTLWVSPADWKYFGIYPNLSAFATIYGLVHVLYAAALVLSRL